MFFFRDPLLIFFFFLGEGVKGLLWTLFRSQTLRQMDIVSFLFVVESLKGGIFGEYYLNLHDSNLQRATRVKSSCCCKAVLSFEKKHLKIQKQSTFFTGVILTCQSRKNKGMIKEVNNGSILLSFPLGNCYFKLTVKSNQIWDFEILDNPNSDSITCLFFLAWTSLPHTLF